MKLDDILNGSRVLIDANIFIYAVEQRSPQCRQLLDRCEAGAVAGVVTLLGLGEVSHRRMINEARSAGLLSGGNLARALMEKAAVVRQLSVYAQNVRDLLDSTIHFEPVLAQDFYVALELQKQHGLLTNDSLNLAVAKRLGIQEIATADKSFDNVQGVIVYKPEDVNPPIQ